MEIKKIANKALNFSINRTIEIIGLVFLIIGLLLLAALLSFSPDDPNFIFPENTNINNFLGFRGSYTADLFFQSFGLISLLMPFSFIFNGVNIFIYKNILLIIESIFYKNSPLHDGAVIIEGKPIGETVLQGEGAGPGPTSSSLLSDLVLGTSVMPAR